MASSPPSLPLWAKRRDDPNPPDGWQEMPLVAVADIRFSNVDKKSYTSEQPVRLCNYTDVYNKEYIRGNESFMHATASEVEISRFALEAGDVIITKDSETPDDIGVPAVVLEAPKDLLCGYHLALIRPRSDQVDPVFLAKQLAHTRISRYYARLANGLTRYGLTNAVVENTPVWLPEPEEQYRVAGILRCIDDAIAKTEALIAKLKAIKQGLLHDLLTRGLDENGELRDLAEDCPFTPLVELADIDPPLIHNHLKPDSVVSFIPMADVSDDGEWVSHQVRHYREVCKGYTPFQEGDILFRKITPCMENGKGCHAVGLMNGVGFGSTEFFVLRAKPGNSARFIYHWTMTTDIRRKAEAFMIGSAGQQRVQRVFFSKFEVPLFPREVQERVARILDAHDQRLRAEEAYLSKLKAIKKGLMRDLLTGRVRVIGSSTDSHDILVIREVSDGI